MAQGMRDLRRRIRGVTSIQKITRAMEMIASTRLRRLQSRAEGARPYADAIRAFTELLVESGAKLVSPLTQPREKVARISLLAISSDRGLCGSYNANLFRKVGAFLGERPGLPCDLLVIGRKARQHYARRLAIKHAYPDEVEDLTYRRAREMARELTDAYLKGGAGEGGTEGAGVDEVWVAYTRFLSAGRQVTTIERLLPIAAADATTPTPAVAGPAAAGATPPPPATGRILLEPSPQRLFDVLVPKSLAVRLFAAMLDSMASEQAARRAAMKAATDAAGDIITALTRKYNRARQEAITKELLDIVGGAEALA